MKNTQWDKFTELLKQENTERYHSDKCLASTPVMTDIFENVTIELLFTYTSQVPLSEILFLLDYYKTNNLLSKEGLAHMYGMEIGMNYRKNISRGLYGDGLDSKLVMRTLAACDAFFGGSSLPALGNAGSVCQGIMLTLPVACVSQHLKTTHETMIRALAFANITALYLYSQPEFAALHEVRSGIGIALAISSMLGGEMEQIQIALKNSISNLAFIKCKDSDEKRTLHMASIISSAFRCALLAIDNHDIAPETNLFTEDAKQSQKNIADFIKNNCI